MLADVLADYFARTVEEPWAGYFAALVLEEEQPSSINTLAGYFDKVVGFLVVDRLGTIAGEYMDCSETIVEGQSIVDYLAKAGMFWGMAH